MMSSKQHRKIDDSQPVTLADLERQSVTDTLSALWNSTAAFFKRFDMFPPPAIAQLTAFEEELKEFYIEVTLPTADNANMVHEAVDVIVTMIGLLQSQGVQSAELTDAIRTVIAKNDAKTHDTHAIDPATGKITRISKLEGRE